MRQNTSLLLLLSSSLGLVVANGHDIHARFARPNPNHPNLFVERGDPYPTSLPEYTYPALADIKPTPPGFSENTLPVKTTYTSGTQPTLTGAPPLPSATVNQPAYPDPDHIPDTDNDQVREWVNAIDWSTIPAIPPTVSRNCSDPGNAAHLSAAGADGNCWWSCGQCTRDIDITTCANPMEYGHGYDDGPGFYTPKLLAYLESNDLHATFFLVGSRIYYNPEMVQYEYMTGHELSVHTWSHGGPDLLGLTQMTNEQVVAELGYTKKIIKEVTGVTPTTMRPPYGDIDDRVRAISLAMGLIPVMWTSKDNPTPGEPAIQWDSQDWRVHGGDVESVPNQATFQSILDSSVDFQDHGVIALQHDIYVEAVNLAIGYTLPYLLGHNPPFTLKPVMQCQGRPIEDAFIETNTNPDSPAVSGSGDVATRTSNLGYAAHDSDDISSVPPSRTYESSGTHTGTSNSEANTGGAVRLLGDVRGLMGVVGSVVLGLVGGFVLV